MMTKNRSLTKITQKNVNSSSFFGHVIYAILIFIAVNLKSTFFIYIFSWTLSTVTNVFLEFDPF